MSIPTQSNARQTAHQARSLVLRHVQAALGPIAQGVAQWLDRLPDPAESSERIQANEDMRRAWLGASRTWQAEAAQRLLTSPGSTGQGASVKGELRLLDEEDVEMQILAGRLAQVVAAPAQDEFNDLRTRLQHLEGDTELAATDPVQAAQIAKAMLDAWTAAGLGRDAWLHCKAQIEPLLAKVFGEACHQGNAWLLQQGVLPHIDRHALLRRGREATPPPTPSPAAEATPASTAPGAMGPAGGAARGAPGKAGTGAGGAAGAGLFNEVTQRLRKLVTDRVPAAAKWFAPAGSGSGTGSGPGSASGAGAASGAEAGAGSGGGGGGGAGSGPAGTAPRPRAEVTTLLVSMPQPPAALLAASAGPIDTAGLQAGVAELRQQTRALKRTASTEQDKAVIEVVALIFDSILAEERLPPSIRVWFARLQMPVLRVALVDADFLGSTEHPARLLLDRMGSCVMGFDAAVSLEPLEAEMRRIVQVVEQYPETGRKVFEIVHREFETFLAKHLLERGGVQKVANLAEQVELKETLTVKFTIELRKLLGHAPVAETVRDFLFHVWTEVLAVATVRHGAQHAQSAALRAVAGELLWMASAKPTRPERAKVIARLPGLMAQLREGMGLLGLDPDTQEQRIKQVSDALVEAFMARTEPLSEQWLKDMTAHLAGLDDYLADADVEPIKLDQYSIEMITGVDASDIVVVPDTGQAVSPALRDWAKGLEQGAWFELSHNGFDTVVRLSWRSPRKQLFLFTAPDRRSFLMQQGRVASYLDTALLKPCEAETLTLRATREALHKLDANPERLLA